MFLFNCMIKASRIQVPISLPSCLVPLLLELCMEGQDVFTRNTQGCRLTLLQRNLYREITDSAQQLTGLGSVLSFLSFSTTEHRNFHVGGEVHTGTTSKPPATHPVPSTAPIHSTF